MSIVYDIDKRTTFISNYCIFIYWENRKCHYYVGHYISIQIVIIIDTYLLRIKIKSERSLIYLSEKSH